jgi:tol-pal system protein YbgF
MRLRDRVLVALLAGFAGSAAAQQLPPVVGPGGTPVAAPTSAAPATVEGRLARIERLLDSGTLVDMVMRLDQLQAELQKLRGEVELHGHELAGIKQRQRDLYLDIDRRLRRAEVGNAAPAATSPPAAMLPEAPPSTPAASTPPPVATAPPPAAATAPPPPAPPAAAVDPAKQQLAYQAAFDLLKEGRYPEAITAFEQFLASYPGGAYSDNAQYWLGEARYVTRDFAAAARDFKLVLAQYPGSPKVPDAMLKLGYAHYELQEWQQARSVLSELRQKYPNSTAARLAANRLERMAQEGR